MEYKGIQHGRVNLFFNWYEDPERQHEIDRCLRINKMIFDRVIVVKGRPTFKDLFELSKQYPQDINCFCNSDIYFTDLTRIKGIGQNECFALTRYDLKDGKLVFFNRRDSFDAYIFNGSVRNIEDCDFFTGVGGCDNAIAERIQRAGYNISNPSVDIVTVHLHKQSHREWIKKPPVTKPYLLINPHRIEEKNVIRTEIK